MLFHTFGSFYIVVSTFHWQYMFQRFGVNWSLLFYTGRFILGQQPCAELAVQENKKKKKILHQQWNRFKIAIQSCHNIVQSVCSFAATHSQLKGFDVTWSRFKSSAVSFVPTFAKRVSEVVLLNAFLRSLRCRNAVTLKKITILQCRVTRRTSYTICRLSHQTR